MKNKYDEIIYVGKAKSLKNRVRQYFQSGAAHYEKVRQMVLHIAEFEYIVTDSEVEALILEANLIKSHTPKYNILLKDDKQFPYIKVTTNEEYPRIFITRNLKKDKAKYYGPFSSVLAAKETVELLNNLYQLRRCSRILPRDIGKHRPCLNYHIGQCSGPCSNYISKEEYNKNIKSATDFLEGRKDEIINNLKNEMEQASENLLFEKAAELRDKVMSIQSIFEKQKMEDALGEDQDIIGMARAHGEAIFQIFFIRGGKMIGRENFMVTNIEDITREEATTEFIKQFYSGSAFIPKEIVSQEEILDKETIISWLSGLKSQKVKIYTPKKGEKKSLVDLASKNALITLNQFGDNIKRENMRTIGAVSEICQALGIDKDSIKRIEAYDVSNIMGFESVGSMVAFEDGKPKRSDYRKFRIKSVSGSNDFESIKEIIYRRFKRAITEKEQLEQKSIDLLSGKFTKLPDLIMVDGGKIQVSAAKEALNELGVNILICGMIKDDKHRTRGLFYDGEEIEISKSKEGFKLITRIQDEVHRFAIEYHRKLREKQLVRSTLDDIEGIGEKRRKSLILHFGDIDGIKKASIEEIKKAPGMNEKAAIAVYKFFHK